MLSVLYTADEEVFKKHVRLHDKENAIFIVPEEYANNIEHAEKITWFTDCTVKLLPTVANCYPGKKLYIIVPEYWDEDLYNNYVILIRNITQQYYGMFTAIIKTYGNLPQEFEVDAEIIEEVK